VPPSLFFGKRLLPLILLLGTQAAGWAANTKLLQKVDSPSALVAMQLRVKEGIDVGGGKPGFELFLSGWPQGKSFDVYALDTDGMRVPLVDAAMADMTGEAIIPVPYESEGLHPGSWIIGVVGKDLGRGERLLVPRVIHGKHGWRLDFKSVSQSPTSITSEAPTPVGASNPPGS
jgi:hypothetical protein